MEARVGDRITIESNRVGGGTRSGEIIEVLDADDAVHYRVRWDDGRETLYYPKAGAVATSPGR